MDIKTELKSLMNRRKYSFTAVARATGLSPASINLWINDNYQGKNEKISDAVANFLQRELERGATNIIPFVETSIVKYIFEVGRLCHTNGEIGLCYGEAGIGKTVAVKEYSRAYSDSILIETDPGYTTKSLLMELHKRLGLSCKGCVYDLMDEITRKLYESGRLLIIDEAENLPYKALEALRRIHDKTGVGILLVGMPVLVENLRGSQNQYKQLYSRVGFSKSLSKLLTLDVSNILSKIDEDENLTNTYWECSKGNTRVLSKLILRSKSVVKMNKKRKIDQKVIEQTSQLLMV